DPVGTELIVDAAAKVGGGGVTAALERHLSLHAVIPQCLFPVEPCGVDLAELEGEVAARRCVTEIGVLQAEGAGAIGGGAPRWRRLPQRCSGIVLRARNTPDEG